MAFGEQDIERLLASASAQPVDVDVVGFVARSRPTDSVGLVGVGRRRIRNSSWPGRRGRRWGSGWLALVGLRVEAKRYLVARQDAYAGRLGADSVASLALQGGPMSRREQIGFERWPYAQEALLLRRADESAKVDGLVVPGLSYSMQSVRRVSQAARKHPGAMSRRYVAPFSWSFASSTTARGARSSCGHWVRRIAEFRWRCPSPAIFPHALDDGDGRTSSPNWADPFVPGQPSARCDGHP